MKRIVVEVVEKKTNVDQVSTKLSRKPTCLGICYPEDHWRMPILYLVSDELRWFRMEEDEKAILHNTSEAFAK